MCNVLWSYRWQSSNWQFGRLAIANNPHLGRTWSTLRQHVPNDDQAEEWGTGHHDCVSLEPADAVCLHWGLRALHSDGDTLMRRHRSGAGDCPHALGPVRSVKVSSGLSVLTFYLQSGHLLILKVSISVTHVTNSLLKRDGVSKPSIHFQMCPVRWDVKTIIKCHVLITLQEDEEGHSKLPSRREARAPQPDSISISCPSHKPKLYCWQPRHSPTETSWPFHRSICNMGHWPNGLQSWLCFHISLRDWCIKIPWNVFCQSSWVIENCMSDVISVWPVCHPGRDASIIFHKSVVMMSGYQRWVAAFYIWIKQHFQQTQLTFYAYNRLST